MSAANATALRIAPDRLWSWLPVVLGIAALFVPTYVRLAERAWPQEAYEHGPIIVAIFWWLVWRQREVLAAVAPQPLPWLGWPLLLAGLFLYFVGYTQNLALFEVAAQIPILAGVLLITLGRAAVRALWFALFFLVFLIPLPGFVIVGVTGQLKHVVSSVAESLLYNAGYPVARDGVMISVGQYRMLVADACSGLNSIYSLSALGLLYIYLRGHASWLRNGVLLASIVPIAFVANVVRVLVLILLTYHFGDAAGQGFMHNASGIVLFVVGLAGMIALDALMGWTIYRKST